MQGIGAGIMDVVHLAIVDGTLAGAIDERSILIILADDRPLISEQALMADEQSVFGTLDEEDVAGVRLGELDGGFNRRLQDVINGGCDFDYNFCHFLSSS